MVLDDLIKSFPFDRIRLTKQASPNLASQAPKVRSLNSKEVSVELILKITEGMYRERHRIIISIVRRAIRRCFR